MRTRLLFIAIISIALSACASYPEKVMHLDITLEQREDARLICSTSQRETRNACVYVYDITAVSKRCRIVMTPDNANENPYQLGEELLHCIRGDWHQNSQYLQ